MLTLLTSALAATLAAASIHAPVRLDIVEIHAKDFAFEGPKTVKANGPITFRLINDGKELHHLTIIKLAKGKTMKDVAEALKSQGPPPAWMTDVGGPNPAVPGGSVDAILNLEPGNYALLCFIPSPGSPMPHMAKGMVSSLTVEADPAGVTQAGAPKGDIVIHTSDYKFTSTGKLTAGRHLVTVTNDAAQSHEVVLVELPPNKTAQDVANWIDKDMMKGAPPAKPVGGMAALAKGRSGTFPVELKSGRYGLLCFIPDAKDGKAHVAHGMVQEITVK